MPKVGLVFSSVVAYLFGLFDPPMSSSFYERGFLGDVSSAIAGWGVDWVPLHVGLFVMGVHSHVPLVVLGLVIHLDWSPGDRGDCPYCVEVSDSFLEPFEHFDGEQLEVDEVAHSGYLV